MQAAQTPFGGAAYSVYVVPRFPGYHTGETWFILPSP